MYYEDVKKIHHTPMRRIFQHQMTMTDIVYEILKWQQYKVLSRDLQTEPGNFHSLFARSYAAMLCNLPLQAYSDILRMEQTPKFLQRDEAILMEVRAMEMVTIDMLGDTVYFAETYQNYLDIQPHPYNESLVVGYCRGFMVHMMNIKEISNRYLLGALMFERFKDDVIRRFQPNPHGLLLVTALQKLYLKIHEDQLQRYQILDGIRQKTNKLEDEQLFQVFMTSLKNISFPMEYRVETDRSLKTIVQTLQILSPKYEENMTLVKDDGPLSEGSFRNKNGVYKMIATRDYGQDEVILQEQPLISFHTNRWKEDEICAQRKRNPGKVILYFKHCFIIVSF
jgi:hypothetical protein